MKRKKTRDFRNFDPGIGNINVQNEHVKAKINLLE